MKILKRKILFVLAAQKDFFYSREFGYKPYQYLYPRLEPYRPSSVRDACLQLVNTGELDKIGRNNEVFFRLTSQGKAQMSDFFPQLKRSSQTWDIIWRILVIAPNHKPGKSSPKNSLALVKLRQKIKTLGFERLTRGVYLSPLPTGEAIKKYVLRHRLANQVLIMESKKLLVGDSAVLGHQLWGLDQLREQYAKFITQTERLLKQVSGQKELSSQTKQAFYLLLHEWFFILSQDPALPRKLIGYNWPFKPARKLFFKLSSYFE